MKNVLKITLLLLVALMMMPDDAMAQRRKKKKKKKKTEQKMDSGFQWQRDLWFGAGGTLNFGGNNFAREFIIGITPMVGYKVTPWLSAGPRFEVTYNTGRYDLGNGEITTLNMVDYGAGLFARAKSPFGIYAHVEYFVQGDEFPLNTAGTRLIGNDLPSIDLNGKIETDRESIDAAFIGLGYNSSGFSKWGYEIQLNYNVLAPEDTVNLPIDLRFGVTYNF